MKLLKLFILLIVLSVNGCGLIKFGGAVGYAVMDVATLGLVSSTIKHANKKKDKKQKQKIEEAIRTNDVNYLVNTLENNSDPFLRKMAAEGLGTQRNNYPIILSNLKKALNDSDDSVRFEVKKALDIISFYAITYDRENNELCLMRSIFNNLKEIPISRDELTILLKGLNNPINWVIYGKLAFFCKNFQAAELAFRQALEINNTYLDAYKLLALTEIANGQNFIAKYTYDEAIKNCPGDSALFTSYGYCLLDNNEVENAINAFKKSVQINSDPVSVASAKLGLAGIYKRHGENELSRAEYEGSLQIYPELSTILNKSIKEQ